MSLDDKPPENVFEHEDHARGCPARYAACECGYEARVIRRGAELERAATSHVELFKDAVHGATLNGSITPARPASSSIQLTGAVEALERHMESNRRAATFAVVGLDFAQRQAERIDQLERELAAPSSAIDARDKQDAARWRFLMELLECDEANGMLERLFTSDAQEWQAHVDAALVRRSDGKGATNG